MIGEASMLVNQLNIDRIYKENIVKEQGSKSAAGEAGANGGNVMDNATFSPQALALAKQVAPVTESPAEEQAETQQGQMRESGSELAGPLMSKSVDIRI